ncbi:MAG: protein translocase subunit SecD [Patescibacteria group bacterium]
MRNPKAILILVLALAVFAALFVYPNALGNKILPWQLGLDLIGGTQLVYEIDMNGVLPADRGSVHDGLRDVMERRVNIFGVSEPHVVTAKSGNSYRILIELAGIRDPQQAINQIGRTALLEFKEVREKNGKAEMLPAKLTGKYLQKSLVVSNPTTFEPEIQINFNSVGGQLFEAITAANIGQPIAIVLDGDVISAPVVQDKISGGTAVITGGFDLKEARNLASLLNAGALPAPVKIVSQQTVGASLGLDSLNKTMIAGAVGTLIVMLFMILYYRRLGFFAAVALLIYVALTLAVFKTVSMTMTLAGIAGFILSIGMAVDANILIFERTKEEIKKGVARTLAINEGFKRAWPSIRDSNISTILTSVILYYMTTSFVKGFALALLIGVLVSMFSAITVTRSLLRVFIKT